ncbi:MAG: hypothetical protein EA397_01515 [Deltaproteobacteria bacterium]|nr:MAG: hypothetical protein EA397_01515 [Deltaproteobacteria bacterium]
MLTLLLGLATASNETELPPAFRGDVSVAYEARPSSIGLAEDTDDGSVRVGRRHDLEHGLNVRAIFAPADGFAVFGGFEHLPLRQIRFAEGRRMLQDPATGRPSSAMGPSLHEPPQLQGRGLLGWWVGVAFAPLAEREHPEERPAPVSYRIDLALRSAPDRTFWEVNDAGIRGPGEGGPTLHASAAFSKETRVGIPYARATFEWTTPRRVTTLDGFGDPVDLRVAPGQRVDVRGGVELPLTRESRATTQVRLDLSTGVGYRSEAQLPSGVLLPDVLVASQQDPVTRAAHLGWHGGLAFDVEIAEPAALRLWTRAFWALPYQLEHPYAVRTTADSVQSALGAEITARFR